MEGFVGRRDLLTREELQRLSAKSSLHGALQLSSHAAALALSSALLAWAWPTLWAVPCVLLQGVLLNWLYCAQHELSHGTVFRSRRANEWIGRVIGFIQLYPRDFDQIQHFAHHRHTGDWTLDPELGRKPYSLSSYLLWFTGASYWWSRVTRLARLTFGHVAEPYVRNDDRARVVREARWHVGLYGGVIAASLALESPAALIYWIGPLLLTKWAYMLQGTIKHLGLPHSENLFENTRTARAGWLWRWLGWNMQYHTAHHLFPSVPFHRLPALHREIVVRAGREPPSMGYFAFQRQAMARLLRGRERRDYADETTWIGPVLRSRSE